VSAAVRLRVCGSAYEVASRALPDVYTVSWVLKGDRSHRIWNDDRLTYLGGVPSRSVSHKPSLKELWQLGAIMSSNADTMIIKCYKFALKPDRVRA
jgi:hypothetical protein